MKKKKKPSIIWDFVIINRKGGTPSPAKVRITQGNNRRITQAGNVRVTEGVI